MKRLAALAVVAAFAVLMFSGLSGCAHNLSVAKLEARPCVQHYEKMRNQLKRKEQSGTEGGCPTCVY